MEKINLKEFSVSSKVILASALLMTTFLLREDENNQTGASIFSIGEKDIPRKEKKEKFTVHNPSSLEEIDSSVFVPKLFSDSNLNNENNELKVPVVENNIENSLPPNTNTEDKESDFNNKELVFEIPPNLKNITFEVEAFLNLFKSLNSQKSEEGSKVNQLIEEKLKVEKDVISAVSDLEDFKNREKYFLDLLKQNQYFQSLGGDEELRINMAGIFYNLYYNEAKPLEKIFSMKNSSAILGIVSNFTQTLEQKLKESEYSIIQNVLNDYLSDCHKKMKKKDRKLISNIKDLEVFFQQTNTDVLDFHKYIKKAKVEILKKLFFEDINYLVLNFKKLNNQSLEDLKENKGMLGNAFYDLCKSDPDLFKKFKSVFMSLSK